MTSLRHCLVLLCGLLIALGAAANPPANGGDGELAAAITEVNASLQAGPRKIPVAGQAQLDLPRGYAFVPAAPSIKLLKALGTRPGDDVSGLIVPDNNEGWFMVVRYIASGYIRDDDARDWKADDLLKNIKAGTEETNQERRQRGLPEVEVMGWVEAPHYEAASHRLVWSLSSRAKSGGDDAKGVNYNTLALGREGYVSMNMVTDLAEIESRKPQARLLLAALDFNDDKRYADFNSSTDKVAEYGLAALVAGVAAKKLGLFAVIAAFAVKFAKVIGLAVIAGGAALTKLFRRKKDEAVPTDQA